MGKVNVGEQVTCKKRVEGYYSRYAGRPIILFRPGQTGVVSAVDVPSVCRERVTFICVDFFCPETGVTERCALLPHNVVRMKLSTKVME